MIVIAGSVCVKADRLQSAIGEASKMAELSRAEAGCSEYRFSIDIDQPNIIRIFEQWDSAEALQAHFAMPHFASFSQLILDVIDGPGDFTRYEVTSAGPLFG